jgi:hypothetical protein
MDLLEYQTMPSLRDVAHDGAFCTSSVVRQGRRHRPSITYKNHTLLGHSPPANYGN